MASVELLQQTGDAIAAAADAGGGAVVGLGRGWGVGSGVIVAPNQVLTSAHNLRDEEVTVTFSDDTRETGRVSARDPDLDLAVITIDTGERDPIRWAQAQASVRIGTPVLALANPGGRGLRVTHGFVSSASRSFRGPRARRIPGAIEHTAPLPRGSSGGPLLSLDGYLLGINSVRVDGGLILAIPADASVRSRVEALGRGETPARFRLGVAVIPPRAARRLRSAVGLPPADGVLIRAVEAGSPAERAGLERGDVITSAAGNPTATIDALLAALDAAAQDESLELEVLRGAEGRAVTVRA